MIKRNHICHFTQVFTDRWIWHCLICGRVDGYEDEEDDDA